MGPSRPKPTQQSGTAPLPAPPTPLRAGRPAQGPPIGTPTLLEPPRGTGTLLSRQIDGTASPAARQRGGLCAPRPIRHAHLRRPMGRIRHASISPTPPSRPSATSHRRSQVLPPVLSIPSTPPTLPPPASPPPTVQPLLPSPPTPPGPPTPSAHKVEHRQVEDQVAHQPVTQATTNAHAPHPRDALHVNEAGGGHPRGGSRRLLPFQRV